MVVKWQLNLVNIVQRGWEAVGTGDFDTLVAVYIEDIKFIMFGQTNVLGG